jgi:hypothetical protein
MAEAGFSTEKLRQRFEATDRANVSLVLATKGDPEVQENDAVSRTVVRQLWRV